MLLVVVVKINCILNMENKVNYNDKVLTIEETTQQKKRYVNVVVKNFL